MLGDGSPFAFDPVSSAVSGDAPDAVAVLCIHGFTGTPFEMRYLGGRLSERGFHAVGPALPGHTTSPAELDRTTWRDWYGAVEDAFDALRADRRHVAVVGQSLGGLLALELARQRGDQLVAVASLAAPLWLSRLAQAAIRATAGPLGRWIRALPKLGGSDIRDRRMKRANPSYRAVPVRALGSLDELMRHVAGGLHEIAVPTLVLHARRDHTAPYACSERIAAAVRGPVVHKALPRSYHLVAIDVERDRVADEVGAFIESRVRGAQPAR